MKKSLILLLIIITLKLILITGYLTYRQRLTKYAPFEPRSIETRPTIVTSFYPWYYFTSQIAGEAAVVTSLTPAGVEPHDYEPSPSDMARLAESDLVIINGQGFEPWADKISSAEWQHAPKIITVTEGLALLTVDEQGENQIDPHVWLDPVLAQQAVQTITAALIEVDPNNRLTYEANSVKLQQQLLQLDQSFQQQLASCRHRTLVTSHAAFGYVAQRYGLEQVAISGLSPDQEPSAKALAETANVATSRGVTYIFFETLVSPRLAETLAAEVGAQTLVFDPLEGISESDQQQGKNYFTVQRENLHNLNIALECQLSP